MGKIKHLAIEDANNGAGPLAGNPHWQVPDDDDRDPCDLPFDPDEPDGPEFPDDEPETAF